VDALDAETLAIDLNGGAQLTATGTVHRLDLIGNGGAQAHLANLAVGSVEVEFSGGATGTVNASESVRGRASGGAVLTVNGDASVDVEVSGGGQVN
jgi:hypothetical protein